MSDKHLICERNCKLLKDRGQLVMGVYKWVEMRYNVFDKLQNDVFV